MDDTINLLVESTSVDEDFNNVATYRRKQVFCRVRSVTMTEFYNAGQAGLSPAYVFEIFHGDYNGEKLLEFKGQRYAIYRTYHRVQDDTIELYAEDKAGVTDGDVN